MPVADRPTTRVNVHFPAWYHAGLMDERVDIPKAKEILRKLIDDDGLTVEEAETVAIKAFGYSLTFHVAKEVIRREDG